MNPTDEDFSYFKECLEKLIGLGLIEDKTALGITNQVMANGYDSLSKKQKYVFDKNVGNKFFDRKCKNCGEEIPWCEMPSVIEDAEKICGHCMNKLYKDD